MSERQPNILLFMVDELRYPTAYDGPELRGWMQEFLVAQRVLRETGVDFRRHYIQSAACAPSRTSIFTGQYPTLHGVTQTDGIGKNAWDPGMYWLDPNTVPTLGDWFRAAGYRTYYKGKWHISHADIIIPGTHDSLPSNDDNGDPIPENTARYRSADRLNDHGFSGWIGPEPHGRDKANTGWMRDPLFMNEALHLLDDLENRTDDTPWLLVNSYVNPHDIVFFGLVWKSFDLPYPQDAPSIPPPPTANENLATKPRCQASYVATYPQMFLPQPTIDLYRQFYYSLQARVEQYVLKVYERLKQSRFFDNTIVVFTSDHGDMLGAHGGMHQKWYQAYEETLHVPLIVNSPLLADTPRVVDSLTSHADLAPTLLGLAGVDVEKAALRLELDHTEVRKLVGRDLAGVVRGHASLPPDEPVFFMTSDNVSQGLNQLTGQRHWAAVFDPNQIEAIVVDLDGETWKYVRYTDSSSTVPPALPEFEMYNLSADPYETINLAYRENETAATLRMRKRLQDLLDEQIAKKCLTPAVTAATTRTGGEGLMGDVGTFRKPKSYGISIGA